MRTANCLTSIAIALGLTVSSLIANPIPAAASGCRFDLGFLTLQQLIPNVVGKCLVDEHYNPINGDGLQETTGGLLVWRKADNWTAFTDGYHTWVNGPNGLQERLNTQRFPWELSDTPCAIPSDAVTFEPPTVGLNGNATGTGSIHNACDQPVSFLIDVLTQARDNSQTIADAPTVFVPGVAPDSSVSFSYQVILAVPNSTPQTLVSWFDDSGNQWRCVDVGADRCLDVDPWLTSAVTVLRSLDEGRALLRIAADDGVQIQRGSEPSNLLASYSPATKRITLDPSLDSYSSWVRATILAHELQHAADDAAGNLTGTTANCYLAEETAFRREAQVWADLWQNHLPPNIDSMHQMLNDITLTVARDPTGFVNSLVAAYQQECDASEPSAPNN